MNLISTVVLLVSLINIPYNGYHVDQLWEQNEPDTLKSNGVYALLDTSFTIGNPKIRWSEIHNIYSPLILINSENAMFLNYRNFVDSSVLRLEGYAAQNEYLSRNVGNYHISNDTLFATLPTILVTGGERTKLFPANYIGIIKNSDTILNWQLVAPYPKVNMKRNENLEPLRTPHLMYFVESKELSVLDSLYKDRLKSK